MCNTYRAHLDSLLEYVNKGVAEGAKLVYGGKQLERPGKLRKMLIHRLYHVLPREQEEIRIKIITIVGTVLLIFCFIIKINLFFSSPRLLL